MPVLHPGAAIPCADHARAGGCSPACTRPPSAPPSGSKSTRSPSSICRALGPAASTVPHDSRRPTDAVAGMTIPPERRSPARHSHRDEQPIVQHPDRQRAGRRWGRLRHGQEARPPQDGRTISTTASAAATANSARCAGHPRGSWVVASANRKLGGLGLPGRRRPSGPPLLVSWSMVEASRSRLAAISACSWRRSTGRCSFGASLAG